MKIDVVSASPFVIQLRASVLTAERHCVDAGMVEGKKV